MAGIMETLAQNSSVNRLKNWQVVYTGDEDISDHPALATGAVKRSQGMEDVVARMKDLATNRGDAKRRSKKERSSLKSTFRDLCSTLEVRWGLSLSLHQLDIPASERWA